MAGINVSIYEVFKLGTNKLKYNNWDLTITKKEAFLYEELISLFEGEEFRLIAQILKRPTSSIDYSKYILSVVIERKSDFKRAVSKRGIKVNGVTFRRFVGTTGGLKNNTLLFVNEEVIDELNEKCDCGRDKTVKFIPAKLEAYKALTCSASQPIISPDGILVVSDCITKFKDTVIELDNSGDEESPIMTLKEDMEIENNVSDGYNLCTIGYMEKIANKLGLNYTPSGVCLRNAWLKGMLYPFPIVEFVEKYNNGSYFVKDIWGNYIDIRKVEMILTESSLKLWSSYSSIEDYVENYKKNGYEFAVTKISPHILEEKREINYQYLQSYEFDDIDIEELCAPTVEYLKDSLCGDYKQTMSFLGINGNIEDYSWQKALATSEYMLGDPYIIDSVHRMIKKKINNAKIGKLFVEGNYQIASGDAFALMQHICGLEITGLLKADECYSQYWADKNVDEVCIFRSPMTSHNNIRKCKIVDNEDVRYWFQYMDTIMIINGWDTFCQAENGCDYDSDILYSTNNKVLLRKHKKLPAINCLQQNCEKIIVTEKDILKSNLNGMGNAVGKITNRATSMMEVQAKFPKDSKEYKELAYRITCAQTYQQDELDKIKGIIAKPMPSSWYNMKACGDDEFLQRTCADKKPYFMIYVYEEKRKELKKYIESVNENCHQWFYCDIDDLLLKPTEERTKEESEAVFWYNFRYPVGYSDCSMNKICKYIEKEFSNYTVGLKKDKNFDYTKLMLKHRCTKKHKDELFQLCLEYVSVLRNKSNDKRVGSYDDSEINRRTTIKKDFYIRAKSICPNDEERFNIVWQLCYGEKNNKLFCWDTIGDLIINRLEELTNGICVE